MLAATPENGFGAKGYVIGLDEAGRGPLAGPVVAGAVALCKPHPAGLDDSKKLSAKRRAELDLAVRAKCAWAVGVVGVDQIDELNILGATMLAMTQAVERLTQIVGGIPKAILIDGNLSPSGRCDEWRTGFWGEGKPIIGGDALEPAISAASIVAKEWRDRLMCAAAIEYPQYGWERNKGYGTKDHMIALREHGPTPLHRRSFAPVAQLNLFGA
ncbi:ribonuclease HII [Pontixanthobacter aestiaquae]|uniref:Ribonuclease HII n=1 Tax=Pontixanthobacter aestiaquae TaxID=1509367 RepID=A0A844Z6W5_9SPHN|nr:ribonuclease HII [Pontixanthobacter aestiaquae]MDN3645935.1 ribonuclease HII [Pontixanthobacter aestiaquae]MXO83072.1 ribonuclease HII [Pontixanthobacter aestiaquae]